VPHLRAPSNWQHHYRYQVLTPSTKPIAATGGRSGDTFRVPTIRAEDVRAALVVSFRRALPLLRGVMGRVEASPLFYGVKIPRA
jgi:hypothetical protein